jgi:uncharacterized protein (TIGR02646 family)
MLPISKFDEPQSIAAYFNDEPKPNYEGFASYSYNGQKAGESFKQLRTQLVAEQKHLCAYCGKVIESAFNHFGQALMKTEHFEPKNDKRHASENDLLYSNLLAVCPGNPGTKAMHCDTSKGDEVLNHITNPALLELRDPEISYSQQGSEVKVYSENEDKKSDLVKILNLNAQLLRDDRYHALKNEILEPLGDDSSNWDEKRRKSILDELLADDKARLNEFTDMLVWFLKNGL